MVLLLGITSLSSHLELSCLGGHTSYSSSAKPSTGNSVPVQMSYKHGFGEIYTLLQYYTFILAKGFICLP